MDADFDGPRVNSGFGRQPDPLTPAECDISDWPGMMLDVARLQKSRAWLICKRRPELAFYMLNLWMAAWHEVPAASLEDDDDVLADRAKCGDFELWLRIKADVMRGFVLCGDGRWYHALIAAKALEAWIEKIGGRISSGAGNAKRWGGEFNDAPLKAQLQIAKDLLQALDPMSKVFARSKHGMSKTTPEKPPKAPRRPKSAPPEAAPVAGPAGGIPPASANDPDGIAREEKGSEGKGSEGKGSEENLSVGGKPPTTPGADAPAGEGDQVEPSEGHLMQTRGKPATGAIAMADYAMPLPDWLAPHAEAWNAFQEIRRKKNAKAPYTAAAQKGILRELKQFHDEGQDLTAILAASANAGWTSVYAQKGARRAVAQRPFAGRSYEGGDLERDFAR